MTSRPADNETFDVKCPPLTRPEGKYNPSSLPEMRDVEVDTSVEAQVQEALAEIERGIAIFKLNREDHRFTLTNVGLAMVFTCRVSCLSMAAQWLLRQRLLEVQWDEVEFELVEAAAHQQVALIEHKYARPPRTLHTELK